MTLAQKARSITVLLIAFIALSKLSAISAASGSEKCSAESNSLYCPNCGGMEVSDCSECDGYLFADHNYEICYDRKLFHVKGNVEGDPDNHYPFLWNDIVGAIIWFITAGIATACGTGGGGIYVPVGILLLCFSPKAATGLSQASIFGAALGGLIVNIRNHHPNIFIRDTKGNPLKSQPGKIVAYEKDKTNAEIEADRNAYIKGGDGKRKFYTRPLVDYDMALFLAPIEMAGAVLGVIIQKLFPTWLFLLIASLVLGFTSYKTYQKFVSTHKNEKGAKEAIEKRVAMTEVDRESSIGNESAVGTLDESAFVGGEEGVDSQSTEPDQEDLKELELRRHYLEIDSRQYPKEKIACLVLLWVGSTIITLLKGGKGVDSIIGITCEDSAYYAFVAGQFIWTMGFASVFGFKNVKKTKERLAVNYPFNETDVLWDLKKLQFYSFVTFLAGIIAGLIGVAGATILGPIMIVMGIHPSVSTATTAAMVLLTSSSVAFIFVMSGLVPWEYACFFFLVCLCGAYNGKIKIDAYVKRTGKSSVLIGIFAVYVALATVGCIANMLLDLSSVNWCLAGFNDFCAVKSAGSGCAERLLEVQDILFSI